MYRYKTVHVRFELGGTLAEQPEWQRLKQEGWELVSTLGWEVWSRRPALVLSVRRWTGKFASREPAADHQIAPALGAPVEVLQAERLRYNPRTGRAYTVAGGVLLAYRRRVLPAYAAVAALAQWQHGKTRHEGAESGSVFTEGRGVVPPPGDVFGRRCVHGRQFPTLLQGFSRTTESN